MDDHFNAIKTPIPIPITVAVRRMIENMPPRRALLRLEQRKKNPLIHGIMHMNPNANITHAMATIQLSSHSVDSGVTLTDT